MKYCWLDTETTGLNPLSDTVWQIAGEIYYKQKSKRAVGRKFNFKNTNEKELYKTFVEFLNKHIDRFDKTDKFQLIAYNAKFDENFLREMFLRNNDKFYGSYFYTPAIDVMQMVARAYMHTSKRPTNFKLATIAKHIGLKVSEGKLHDAAYDANITRKVYNNFK